MRNITEQNVLRYRTENVMKRKLTSAGEIRRKNIIFGARDVGDQG